MRASALARSMARPVKPSSSCVCECGNGKPSSAEACARCVFLDGDDTRRGRVIAALRGTEGLTLRELALAVYGRDDRHVAQRSTLRVIRQLESAGRLTRFWREHESSVRNAWRGTKVSISYGGWTYSLTDRGSR